MEEDSPRGFAMMPIWLLRCKEVSQDARTIYLHLSAYVGEDKLCWPSQLRLADESGMSERQVRRCIKELRDQGIVTVEVIKHATGRRNVYRLMVDRRGGAAKQAGPIRSPRPEN